MQVTIEEVGALTKRLNIVLPEKGVRKALDATDLKTPFGHVKSFFPPPIHPIDGPWSPKHGLSLGPNLPKKGASGHQVWFGDRGLEPDG